MGSCWASALRYGQTSRASIQQRVQETRRKDAPRSLRLRVARRRYTKRLRPAWSTLGGSSSLPQPRSVRGASTTTIERATLLERFLLANAVRLRTVPRRRRERAKRSSRRRCPDPTRSSSSRALVRRAKMRPRSRSPTARLGSCWSSRADPTCPGRAEGLRAHSGVHFTGRSLRVRSRPGHRGQGCRRSPDRRRQPAAARLCPEVQPGRAARPHVETGAVFHGTSVPRRDRAQFASTTSGRAWRRRTRQRRRDSSHRT